MQWPRATRPAMPWQISRRMFRGVREHLCGLEQKQRRPQHSDNADVSYFNAIGTGRSFEKVHLIGSASLSVLNRRVERQHPGA
jgi:hypothetical protein